VQRHVKHRCAARNVTSHVHAASMSSSVAHVFSPLLFPRTKAEQAASLTTLCPLQAKGVTIGSSPDSVGRPSQCSGKRCAGAQRVRMVLCGCACGGMLELGCPLPDQTCPRVRHQQSAAHYATQANSLATRMLSFWVHRESRCHVPFVSNRCWPVVVSVQCAAVIVQK
jgi:hypothetical protein